MPHVKIDTASSGANELIAAITGKVITVHQLHLVCAGAVTVDFKSATTSRTGAMSFAANGGIQQPYSPVGHYQTAAGEAFNMVLGGAVGVQGSLFYTTN